MSIHNISPDIEEYFKKEYEKLAVKCVYGHWPVMTTKEDVDKWVSNMKALEVFMEHVIMNQDDRETDDLIEHLDDPKENGEVDE